MKEDFELVSYTADAGIRARGETLEAAFAAAARGLLSLITDPAGVREVVCREIEVSAPDRETLLVEWLNELIFLFDTELLLFKKFEILDLNDKGLKARCRGERVDKSRHEIKHGVKSATYHDLEVKKLPDGAYQVRVLIDL